MKFNDQDGVVAWSRLEGKIYYMGHHNLKQADELKDMVLITYEIAR
jgi:hypothetical protein